MAKLDIDFILLDESLVMHGFRALMSGADLEDFKKNPVLLIQHIRGDEGTRTPEMILPIGRWYDIRIEANKLLAKPDFDDSDELAMRVQKKVEGGYMNGASIWIVPTVVSDDVADMLPGQNLPTFTKWSLLEASIVDIPNCRNSLAIRNSAGKRITLNSNTENKDLKEYLSNILKIENPIMDKKVLCLKLGIPEDSSEGLISEKLSAFISNSNASALQSAEIISLKDEVVKLKGEAETKLITDLVDGAILAGKLTAGDKIRYVKLATADYNTTKEVIDSLKAQASIESLLSGGNSTEVNKLELEALVKLSGKELYMNGKLDRLQVLSPEHFQLKYKDAFGFEFKA